jgi:hypothetical protein
MAPNSAKFCQREPNCDVKTRQHMDVKPAGCTGHTSHGILYKAQTTRSIERATKLRKPELSEVERVPCFYICGILGTRLTYLQAPKLAEGDLITI